MPRILIADKEKFQPVYTRRVERLKLDIETLYASSEELAISKLSTEALDLALVDKDLGNVDKIALVAENQEVPIGILYFPNIDESEFEKRRIYAFLDKVGDGKLEIFLREFFKVGK